MFLVNFWCCFLALVSADHLLLLIHINNTCFCDLHSTEMTRLTNELESVYVDERRDALDKLQAEHIEELRALTNRYTANEDELRAEVWSEYNTHRAHFINNP